MGRESHRYRGVRRRSTGGWGHRAIYVAAAVATASLVSGFALAGYWFGTFSHVFPQATAQGLESAPYHVVFLGMGATYAGLLDYLNFTNVTWNSTTGPCENVTANGTNMLNSTGASMALNLSMPNATDSSNATVGAGNETTIVCLNAVDNGGITELWGNYTNQSGWDNVSAPSNASFGNVTYNVSLANLTGNANLSGDTLNITGCNPVVNNTSIPELTNCPFFASNNNTTYLPHAGFWDNGVWYSEANSSDNNSSTFWHPNQTGYLPSDSVFYASVLFYDTAPNVTYEVDVEFQGATPIPQVFFVNTGSGDQNDTVTFVFDTTIAWTTALTNNSYGLVDGNVTNGTGFGSFDSYVVAQIGTVSVTVSQCYVDASAQLACPDTLGGSAFP
jgi:hypothetical protein